MGGCVDTGSVSEWNCAERTAMREGAVVATHLRKPTAVPCIEAGHTGAPRLSHAPSPLLVSTNAAVAYASGCSSASLASQPA
eukprot:3940842-Rhodomonas_salina.3